MQNKQLQANMQKAIEQLQQHDDDADVSLTVLDDNGGCTTFDGMSIYVESMDGQLELGLSMDGTGEDTSGDCFRG